MKSVTCIKGLQKFGDSNTNQILKSLVFFIHLIIFDSPNIYHWLGLILSIYVKFSQQLHARAIVVPGDFRALQLTSKH